MLGGPAVSTGDVGGGAVLLSQAEPHAGCLWLSEEGPAAFHHPVDAWSLPAESANTET